METTAKFSAVIAGVWGRVSNVSLVLTPTKVEQNLAHSAVLDAWVIRKFGGGGYSQVVL